METSSISQRIKQIAMAACAQKGLEFVHSEVAGTKRNPVVRVFVDKPGGVTVEDCGELSRLIEAVLDADDFIPSAYILEVSSPGLERELYSIDDFKKFIGRKARIKTSEEFESRKAFKGTIDDVEGDEIVFSERSADVVRIPYKIVKKANLVFDIADDLRKV